MSEPTLTDGQRRALMVLYAQGRGLTDKRVASMAQLGRQGAQAILRTLVTKGLVEKELVRPPTGSGDLDRYYVYRLTEAGSATVAGARAR
jgi:predicted transcriptional regulator